MRWGNLQVPGPVSEVGTPETPALTAAGHPEIIELQSGLGWKGPYRPSCSTPPAMGRDPFHQPRVLRALSNLALNTARDGAATASLGNLCQVI